MDGDIPGGGRSAAQISRRATLAVVGGTGLTLLAACGTSPTSSSAQAPASSPSASTSAFTAQQSSAPAEQPRMGGTIQIGQVGDLPAIDGHNSGSVVVDTVYNAFDALLDNDGSVPFKPKPLLAVSWDLSSDDKQFKLNLRQNVQFHTGREFTSDDVKYNLMRVRNPAIGGKWSGPASWWTTIDTPDKYTVVLTSDKPRPGVFDGFQLLNMVDRETVEGPDAKTKSVGTGPFSLLESKPGDHLTFLKNKNYWQSGKPYLDQLTMHIGRDPQAMVAQLEAGATDLADRPPTQDVARLGKNSEYVVLDNKTNGGFFYMGLNTTKPPFDKKQVRQAIQYAIDRKRWTDTILAGLVGPPQNLPWPPSSPAYEAAKNNIYSFDLDKAKSLFAAAGVSAFETDISFGQNDGAEFAQMAQVMQADLATIGIKINIKPLDQAAFQAITGKLAYDGIILYAGSSTGGQEASRAFVATGNLNVDKNFQGFTSDTWKQLVNTASTEPDAAKRKAIYAEINDLLLDEAFGVMLSVQAKFALAHSKVHGVIFNGPDHGLQYLEAWLG